MVWQKYKGGMLWRGQPSSRLFTSICFCQPPPQSGAGTAALERGRASPVSYEHTQIIYKLYSSKAALRRPRRDLPPIRGSNIASRRVAANLCDCQECDEFFKYSCWPIIEMERNHQRHLSPILCIMECIIASVFTRHAKRETECGRKH